MRPLCSAAFRRMLGVSLTFLTAGAISSGCGDGKPKPDASSMAAISGSVTNDGKPISQDSHVIFYCSEKAATAAGKTDALGKFTLKEADPSIGIPAGRYQVSIRPPDQPAMTVGSDEYTKMMSRGAAPVDGRPPTPPERASDIPSKFHDFLTSGLELEVKPGPNTFDLDLVKLAR